MTRLDLKIPAVVVTKCQQLQRHGRQCYQMEMTLQHGNVMCLSTGGFYNKDNSVEEP